MKTPTFAAAALFALLVAPLFADLPPDAQAAMDKGVLAAQQQDFSLAAKFFAEARASAPEAPELLYNLGLAESKIPGRELRAIAWFGAYLAANPTATNAAAVKKQMGALDVTSQVSTTKLVKTVVEAAKLLHAPDKPDGLVLPYIIGGPLHDAAVLLTKNGETAEALKIAAGIKDLHWRSWAQAGMAQALAESGDKAGASKFLRLAMQTDKSFITSNWDEVQGGYEHNEIAARLIEEARKRKAKVTGYLADAEASLGKGPLRKSGKGLDDIPSAPRSASLAIAHSA